MSMSFGWASAALRQIKGGDLLQPKAFIFDGKPISPVAPTVDFGEFH
jgi:hypothetical protein